MTQDEAWTKETFLPVRESIALVAAPATEQICYVTGGPIALPVVELLAMVEDYIPNWLPKLVKDRVISDSLADRIESLRLFLIDAPGDPWRDDLAVFAEESWNLIRVEAGRVLLDIDAELNPS